MERILCFLFLLLKEGRNNISMSVIVEVLGKGRGRN